MIRILAITGFLVGFYTSAFAILTPEVDSIPMRDGKWLLADVYVPQGCANCPAILIQTPYSRLPFRWSLPLGVGQQLDSSDYVFVIVDWRGFYGSLPAAIPSPNRGEDGYDCIEWITQQSWSNGKVGTWGPSALGKVQFETAREQHPAHLCAVPLVASPRFAYEEYYPGGVFRTEYVEQLDALGFGLSGVILANQVKNINWNVAYSQSNYPGLINTPCLMVGGWYDHATDPVIDFFLALRSSSPLAVRDQHRLLMGPWVHGGHGTAMVGSATQGELQYPDAEGWSDSLALRFFDYHLRNTPNGWDTSPYVTYFQMGEDTWNQTASWPPSGMNAIRLYLKNDFSLSSQPESNTTGNSAITLDPSDPSPTHGGATLRQDLLQGPYEQNSVVESRTDLLIFDSPQLGAPVVSKGKIKAHLYVASDRTDTDFAIRVTDVYPDGRSMLLGDGIRRMRFRNGYTATDTSSIVPGQVYEVDIEIMTKAITFLPGHKIRVDISSSNYPRYDVNLNNGGAMYVAGDTLVANNTVYHNFNQASYVEFQMIDFIGSAPDEPLNDRISVFPNPVENLLYLNLSGLDLNYWKVTDLSGKEILNGKAITGNYIDVANLESGVYLLSLNTNQGIVTKKWIKI